MRECAYAIRVDRRLVVGRHTLGLTVAARQNIAYVHTAPQPS
jgi:hypothetical protein